MKRQASAGITKNHLFIVFRFLAEAASRAGSLLIFPLMARYLGAEGYGVQAQANAIIGILIPVAALGLGYSVVRLIAGQQDVTYISRRFWSSLLLVAGVSTILSILVVMAAQVLNALFVKVDWATPVIRWSSLLIVLTAIEAMLNDFYRARLRILAYSSFQIVQALLTYGGAALILVSGGILIHIIWLTIAVKGLTVILLLGYFIHAKEVKTGEGLLPRAELWEMVHFGLPIIVVSISNWVIGLSDRTVIGFFMNIRDVGVYNASYNFAGIIGVLAAPFWGPLYPLMAACKNEGDRQGLMNVCRKYTNAYLLIGLPALLGLMIIAPTLLTTLGSQEFSVSRWVFGTIVLGLFLDQFSVNAHYLVYLHNEPAFLRNVVMLAGGINIALNLILVPLMGMLGAGIATLVAYGLLDVLVFSKVLRYGYRIGELYDFSTLGRFALSALAMSIPVYILLSSLDLTTMSLFMVIFAGAGSYAMFVIISFGFNFRRIMASL